MNFNIRVYVEVQQTWILSRVGQEIGVDRGRITEVILYFTL